MLYIAYNATSNIYVARCILSSVAGYSLYSLVAAAQWQVASVPVTAYESGPNHHTPINPTRLRS